jgi:predicted O-methyltransferase YrrM
MPRAMRHTHTLSETLYDYLLAVSLREPPLLARLREETATLPHAIMQISPEQGQFMALLAELVGARRVVDVGTFTGYSALVVALALPADGRLITCDVNEETTAIARRYWAEAGVADKIEMRIGPAEEVLAALIDEGLAETFDFAFIDADKAGLDEYYERALDLVRPGGVIAVDNTLWSGRVADPDVFDSATMSVRGFNVKVFDDDRVSMSLVPIGDGLTLLRKKGSTIGGGLRPEFR